MKKILFLLLAVLAGLPAGAIDQVSYDVVPLPRQVNLTGKAPFVLDTTTVIVVPGGDEQLTYDAFFLSQYVADITPLHPTVSPDKHKKAIRLMLDPKIENKEGYRIDISAKGIVIAGKTSAGVFYGIQTLRKSIPVTKEAQIAFPSAQIEDQPRFAYRGMHLDCSRHFFPADVVKRYIDLLALHNMNTFHWHLTDDQGWRLEIKKYPQLTEKGSVRSETVLGHNSDVMDGRPHGGIYSQEVARDIVRYAAQRHITVIPEIDMPGHMLGVLTAFPELGCTGGPYELWKIWGVSEDVLCLGNEKVYGMMQDILTEVMDIFPSAYIHLGGDEAPTTRWEHCPKCRKLMDEQHLTLHTLQSYFTNRMEKFINSKGRRMIGWDEILEGPVTKDAVVMSWRGAGPGMEAAKRGHDVIMTPNDFAYFDYYQTPNRDAEPLLIGGNVPVEKVYGFDPCAKELSPEARAHVLGVQANLWTEYIPYEKLIQYQVLPRMAALSEVQWMQPEQKNFEAFKQRVGRLARLYDAYRLTYARHLWKQ